MMANSSFVLFTVEIITVGHIFPNAPGAIPFIGPGLDTAIEELGRLYGRNFNFTHKYLFDSRYPNAYELATGSDVLVASWYYSPLRRPGNLTVFIFGGSLESYPTNRLAGGWNTLMMTSVTNGQILRNRELSPTWITGSCVSLGAYLRLYDNLLQTFKWRSIYVIADAAANPVYLDLHPSLLGVISRIEGSQCTSRWINSGRSVVTDLKPYLLEFQTMSRVLIFLGRGETLRQLMLEAFNQSMTGSEYVFIAMEVFESPLYGRFTWKAGDSDDNMAREAFRSVLLLGPDRSIYDAPSTGLVHDWKRRTLRDYNVSYDEVNPYVMSSYSSVLIFGQILNETLTAEELPDFRDGKALAQRFMNRSFRLDYTEVYIDEAGERRPDLVVRDLDLESGRFVKKLLQEKKHSHLITLGDIDWGGDSADEGPPQNEPPCGYRGHARDCQRSNHQTAIVTGVLVTLCGVVGAVTAIYAAVRRSNKAADMWWKLQLVEEITGTVSVTFTPKTLKRIV
ncbi:hypothetical protein BV898_05069 [Hypsibius exemplaris]|uniref:Receptor ligand binding region domain-containing protein n=1 Tax=Hypsibius exemplaris TaxID=2072580 RepID=A0A1W0X0L1_HYPEX|nr:hypothetical protein BV898_05069 [Hypsibius exemplaris]